MTAVYVVVLIASHVDDLAVVSCRGALRSAGLSVSEGDGTELGQSRKAVSEGDGFDDPFTVHLAEIARGFIWGELVRERLAGALVGKNGGAAAGRVCRHLHVDVVARSDVPALVKVLNRLLRPPLVPRYAKMLVLRCFLRVGAVVLESLTANGTVTVDQNAGLHEGVSAVATTSAVNTDPNGDGVVGVLARDIRNDDASLHIGDSLSAQERAGPVSVGGGGSSHGSRAAALGRAARRSRDPPKVGNGTSQSKSNSRLHDKATMYAGKRCGKKYKKIWVEALY